MISDAEQSEQIMRILQADRNNGRKKGAVHRCGTADAEWAYSRPQIPIESVQYIAIHYTANPGATAIANRNYFENLATTMTQR